MRQIGRLVLIVFASAPVVDAVTYQSSILFSISVPAGFVSSSPSNQPQTSATTEVVGSATDASGYDHAIVWTGASGTDLSTTLPSGFVRSYAVAGCGAQQVGYAEASSGAYSDQALLWSTSARSMINLNPTSLGFSTSEAHGVGGGEQVGYATGSGVSFQDHAVVWSGSANSAVDLNPSASGITNSIAFGTDGTYQVGQGNLPGSSPHALLWNGSAGSAVDLNPQGFSTSQAVGVGYGQEVGNGSGVSTSYQTHALLWTGSAGSVTDLNPTNISGIQISQAQATNGLEQVGWASGSGSGYQLNAMIWSGSSSTAVDLQPLLPAAGSWVSSYASAIDASGNIYGIAKGTINNITGFFAVEWTANSGAASQVTDIASGHEVIANATLASVTAQAAAGYNSGNWNGTTGIVSSAAAADSQHLTAVGVIQNNQGGSAIYSASNPFDGDAPNASDILVKYTYYGDTNLDGQVDGSDYSRLDSAVLANQSTPNSMTGWFNGDFNYDGVINGSDYTLIDNAFNTQGASLASETANVTTEIAAPNSITTVPEPSVAIALMAASFALGRKRMRTISPEAV